MTLNELKEFIEDAIRCGADGRLSVCIGDVCDLTRVRTARLLRNPEYAQESFGTYRCALIVSDSQSSEREE